MSRTVSPSSSRPYGLARVCRVWRASRASVIGILLSARTAPARPPQGHARRHRHPDRRHGCRGRPRHQAGERHA